jgi:hypothetical protein
LVFERLRPFWIPIHSITNQFNSLTHRAYESREPLRISDLEN